MQYITSIMSQIEISGLFWYHLRANALVQPIDIELLRFQLFQICAILFEVSSGYPGTRVLIFFHWNFILTILKFQAWQSKSRAASRGLIVKTKSGFFSYQNFIATIPKFRHFEISHTRVYIFFHQNFTATKPKFRKNKYTKNFVVTIGMK